MGDRNTGIRGDQIKNLTIKPEDLMSTNALGSAMDDYIPSYDLSTGKFTWIVGGGAPSDAKYLVGDVSDVAGLSNEILTKNIGLQNLILNGNFELWSDGDASPPDGWGLWAGSVAKESTEKKIGNYSCKLSSDGSGAYIDQRIDLIKGIDYWRGRAISILCWVKTNVADKVYIKILADIAIESSYHTGSNNWELLTATGTIPEGANGITARCRISSHTSSIVGYFDGFMIVEGDAPFAFTPHPSDTLKDGLTEIEINEDGIKIGGVGATIKEFSIDGTLGGNSDTELPTEKAVKTYVDDSTQTLFEIDMNGDLQPVTTTQVDASFELDGNDDIMPKSA